MSKHQPGEAEGAGEGPLVRPAAGRTGGPSAGTPFPDAQVRSYFERHGEPDRLPGLSGGILQAAIRRAALGALAQAPRPILDAGCGDGQLLEQLPEAEGLLGCDFALPVLRAAKRRLRGQARFVGGRLQALPLRDGIAGTIVCVNTLYNLPSRAGLSEALAEFARVVRARGKLIFELRNPLHPLVQAVFWWKRTAEHPLWSHALPETRRCLEACGLETASVVPILGPCPSLALANLVVAERR